MSTNGMAGFVLAKGSLTSKTNGEGETQKAIIEVELLDCIINLPAIIMSPFQDLIVIIQ